MRRLAPRELLALGTAAGLLFLLGPVSGAGAFVTTTVTTQPVSEPGVVAAPDGTFYVDGPEGILSTVPTSPSPVFRSDDGGATWKETPFGTRAAFPGGGDSDLAIDPANGALYMTDLWLGDSTVSTSSDKGETWLANPLQGVVAQDRQWVATSGNGIVYHAVHQIPLGLVVSRSSGGLVYPQSTVAATPADQTGCICPPGNLIAEAGPAAEEAVEGLGSGNEMVGLIYATSAGGIKFARSSDSGLSFANEEVQPESTNETNASFPVVADAGGGHLVATWLNLQPETSSVAYSESSDWGETWSAPRTLIGSGTSVYPWIAASGSKVAISLYHTSAAGTPETVPAEAQWFETYLESTDGGATFSEPVEVDPGLAAKRGPICLEGVECSEGRELGDFQSLTVDGEGRADLAWMHVEGEESTEVLFSRQPAVGGGEPAAAPAGGQGEGVAVIGSTPGTAQRSARSGGSATGAGAPGGRSRSPRREIATCVARARRSAAKRLTAARQRRGRAKLRSIRAAHRRERHAIAACRSHSAGA